ncbi:MAG: Alanine racemase [uncultured Propionibacteriaceae bacterium]|uniref:Alanine racemase n=1 Tax=uncultured Propionibacteriaceae bacterium TaxID=257457 RepID=A0A6J4PIW9_9ACTN|nr:MAG: Alanine racemase [uncultured Propionibacteriaceae bacterium]
MTVTDRSADPASSPLAGIDPRTAHAAIDLAAFRRNIAVLRSHVGDADVMVVVKADGYGHGLVPSARAARAAGVGWLGVATPTEALTLRQSGDEGRLLAWLYGVDEDLTPLVAADVDVSAQSTEQLSRLVAAAGTAERPARVHLKIDTGLSRNGIRMEGWDDLCAAAAEALDAGAIQVVGIWSHLAAADEPGHPSVASQIQVFHTALAAAHRAGLRPSLRHLANSAGALVVPEAHFDLVRVGIAAYGIDPAPGIAALAGVELTPVMTVRAQLVNVKAIQSGDGVSYGHTWVADCPTTVGLVPLGYADGIPRHASDTAQVGVGSRRAPIRGRVCMDQFVVDLGVDAADLVGDEVVVFGSGSRGEPTAADWADWCDTIGYEIVTRVGVRVPRHYIDGVA